MEADSTDYVLDANLIMSILISGKAYHREVLTETRCCSIDFVFDEISKYEAVIQTKAKLSKISLQHFVFDIFSLITVVPSFVINDEDWQYAAKICQTIDSKDVAYVALSKATSFPLVTRDKTLYTGLRRKGFRSVILFDDFLGSI
ncbi:PIN domain-containing protein [Spirosoma spitsbergense]|uniref:PIN domain-containing protein n=1 Tax=Spirosoma spitsbergense TaxID=431554 RepID=UPI00037D2F71|nr:PIN domain-containing protein [Spirosoma spitsbergense]